MKFIHTADWHLGNKMHEVERTKEFENFFNWLKNTIIEEKDLTDEMINSSIEEIPYSARTALILSTRLSQLSNNAIVIYLLLLILFWDRYTSQRL